VIRKKQPSNADLKDEAAVNAVGAASLAILLPVESSSTQQAGGQLQVEEEGPR
jgi:hypothetical protein